MNQTSINITLNSIKNIKPHTHSGLECILLLKGRLQVEINGDFYNMLPDDIILINHRDIHACHGEYNNLAIMLYIEEEFLKEECGEILKSSFCCNSILQPDFDKFHEIKRLLTQMLLVQVKNEKGANLEIHALLFRFLVTLMQRFQVEGGQALPGQAQGKESISRILDYIQHNYASTITLTDAARQLYMSPQYFSKYFKNKMGISFLQYLNQVRLEHAVVSLIGSSKPVIKIAMEHGFANAKAFSAAFQKQYGKAPGEYRKLHAQAAENKKNEIEEITSNIQDNLLELVKYMKEHDMHQDMPTYSPDTVELDLSKETGQPLKKPEKMIGAGRITDVLQSGLMEQLTEAGRQLYFEFIYFEDFDLEEVEVKQEEVYHNYICHEYIHQIEKLQMTPYVQIDVSRQMDRYEGCLTAYKERLSCFADVLRSHNSRRPTGKWRFEIACKNPDHLETFGRFYHWFLEILREKGIGAHVGILIPDWAMVPEKEGRQKFFGTVKEFQSAPEFAGFHGYPRLFTEQDNERTKQQLKYFYVHRVEMIQALFTEYGLFVPPLYMTRWNTLTGSGSAEAGAFFRSALIFDSLLQLRGKVEAVGFPASTYHTQRTEGIYDFGILGLFWVKKVRRPVYFVLEALNRLKGQMVFCGDSIMVTREGTDEFCIAVYHPYYMNPLYSVDFYFIEHEIHQITILLQGLRSGTYRMKRFIFDQGNAGVFGRWLGVGMPDLNDPEVIDYLEHAIYPECYFWDQEITGSYSLHTNLTFNGLVLYTIKKQ
ncbi:helix-turn-helix domain-containing protein [Lacrimispora sp.]|uniref:helix-turn-helix domain-containing protein n=1 Tax=Lacrimispora sp. TaxID=2719234 RepID=UPI00345F7D56